MSWITVKEHRPIFYQDESKTLLDTLEDAKVEIYSECRNGYCGSCKSKLIRGEVYYPESPLTFLDDQECLPCICYPKGDVEIEIE
ncbi:class I ribonucleotide reductase maintenance protein YfaE [Paraferrimonas sp. SM1919]|uniref:class I ribonucleotide reductase maintenance protein YfaE n=1 Tax=Paraferrimonas sp. SM1919 TaxID=2662263 RepID=UPI0013D797DB|nr:class I ribonucleotide reductase maintenance protein YfaE [Paraferrimonas sp. SM1919]